jgi:TonB family protein
MALISEEAAKLSKAAVSRGDSEMGAADLPPFAGPPEPGSPAALGFRSPVPYRRIKPEYTSDAALYDVRGSVDIEIDLSSEGHIEATRIKKWAGYGLDEAAERAVRTMNWRPAERGGKPIALRFVMRFNFKRVEKE